MSNRRRPFLSAATMLALWALPAMAQQAGQMPPKQVGVITLAEQEVPRSYTLPGRAVAQAEVAIRPRVGGVVTEILYNPGAPIEKGAPMFRIDPVTYEAAVREAEANLASARAAVPQAQAAFDRAQKLVGSGATQADLESAQATLEKAQAAVQAADAALTQAQTQLSWTTITSPLAGLASVADVSIGDLVTAGQTDALATVTQLDPIEVDMYEPSARMQRIRDDIDAGRLTITRSFHADLTLENGVAYSATGQLVAPGFTVSTSTGSVDFRFRFDNPERRILPGMFVRGTVQIGTIKAILVPQQAATRSREGTLTAWVVEEGKAAQRVLTEDGTYQNDWIVSDGVKPGEVLAVNGLSGLAAGTAVQTVPATIDENGVVRDAAPAEATPAPAE
ncbi:MAG: efflux RND transporter periplasmic adaptor subunit [Paracoccaceae bacterium]